MLQHLIVFKYVYFLRRIFLNTFKIWRRKLRKQVKLSNGYSFTDDLVIIFVYNLPLSRELMYGYDQALDTQAM